MFRDLCVLSVFVMGFVWGGVSVWDLLVLWLFWCSSGVCVVVWGCFIDLLDYMVGVRLWFVSMLLGWFRFSQVV